MLFPNRLEIQEYPLRTSLRRVQPIFGDSIELALARDTLEGQSRADIGVKKAEGFKPPGHQSRIRIMIAEGDFKRAYALRDYSEADGKVTLQPVPQIGFRQRESGGYKYFPLDELPGKKQLEELDLDLHLPKVLGLSALM
jgi:hypothetical protein